MELVALVAVTLGVIALAGRLPEARHVKRDLARRRLDTVRALVHGKPVTLRGTVRAVDGALTAPVSGRRCVYWRLTRETPAGRIVERTEDSRPFELQTADGSVRVVASTPRLGVHGELDVRAHERVTEHAIVVGTEVTIRGLCTYEPDPTRDDLDGVYRGGERPTRPVISGSRRVRLQIG